MVNITRLGMALTLGTLVLAVTAAGAQQKAGSPAGKGQALTTMDYIELQQLGRKFIWALDSGDNYGYAYADLFTPDGSFVDNTDPGNVKTTQGRDNLSALARGGTRGPLNLVHWGMNHVITPQADGATGQAYVVVLDVASRPNAVGTGGRYEDVYEKTGLGWRFKKRAFYPSKADVIPLAAVAGR
jgi:hypothetical protein